MCKLVVLVLVCSCLIRTFHALRSNTRFVPSQSSSTSSGGQSSSSRSSTGSSSPTFELQDYLIRTSLNASGYTSRCIANGTANDQGWLTQLPDGNWTVFAPTNEACEYSPTSLVDSLTFSVVFVDFFRPWKHHQRPVHPRRLLFIPQRRWRLARHHHWNPCLCVSSPSVRR